MLFYNYPTWTAQTVLAASYGLMQLMYPVAVNDMQWEVAIPGARHPSALFNASINLDIGSRFDAKNQKRVAGGNASPVFPSLSSYLAFLKKGFQRYNPYYLRRNGCNHDYGPYLVDQAPAFRPVS